MELGTIKDLSLTRASRLLDVLGMSMAVTPPGIRKPTRPRTPALTLALTPALTPALTLATRTASTSYRRAITDDQLRQVLTGAEVPKPLVPHLRTLLEEAPMSLLASAVEQIHEEEGVATASIGKRMRDLARARKSARPIWQ